MARGRKSSIEPVDLTRAWFAYWEKHTGERVPQIRRYIRSFNLHQESVSHSSFHPCSGRTFLPRAAVSMNPARTRLTLESQMWCARVSAPSSAQGLSPHSSPWELLAPSFLGHR